MPFDLPIKIARAFLKQLWQILALLGDTLYWVFVGPFRKKAVSPKNFFSQTVFAGIDSILIVFFVDFFIGMVLAMQSAYQLKKLGATIYVASLVGVSMPRFAACRVLTKWLNEPPRRPR